LQSLRAMLSAPRWVLGFVTGIAGWAIYVVALRFAPLSIVQAASASGIGVLALLAHAAGAPLAPRERRGVVVAVASLVLLALSLHGGVGGGRGSVVVIAACIAGAALAASVLAMRPHVLRGGASLGAAAGIMYAAGDVATKAATAGGARAAVFVPILLACHGLGFVALQLAFQRGGMLATAGVATVLTNALPIAAGVLVFAEKVPPDGTGIVRSLAFTGAVAAAALLARADGRL
jgi:hypothetical protein